MTQKRKGLGRGLSALLESPDTDITSKAGSGGDAPVGSIAQLRIDQIKTNPFQPRTHFEEQALKELSHSIAQLGLIQPITVRKMGYDQYELISGERRYRASIMAGLTHIPAYIRIANDQAMLEMALVENIQREQLDPIEVALSYQRLIEECNLTQEEVSEKVSKSRPAVANHLRLLKLPAPIQAALREHKISIGHARTLIGLENEQEQMIVLERMLNENWSVRQAETELKTIKKTAPKTKKIEENPYEAVSDQLSDLIRLPIQIKANPKGQGTLSIQFRSDKELKTIVDLLSKA